MRNKILCWFKMLKSSLDRTLIYSALILFTVITVYPFFSIFLISAGSPPVFSYKFLNLDIFIRIIRRSAWDLQYNYDQLVMNVPFWWKNVWNSIYIAGMSAFLSVVVASLGGFGFAVYKFKGKEIIFTIMLATLMIPLVVSVIPYFYVMKTIGWFDKARSLYLPAMASSYGVFLMRKYIESAFPRDLLDAARIDGCGEFGIYYKIVLPVILPGLAALGIISFISSWTSYMLPMLFMTQRMNWTLPLTLAYIENPSVRAIAVVITVIPVSIIYLFLSRFIISGFTMGSTTDE